MDICIGIKKAEISLSDCQSNAVSCSILDLFLVCGDEERVL